MMQRHILNLFPLLLATFLYPGLNAQSGPANDNLADAIVYTLADLPVTHIVDSLEIDESTREPNELSCTVQDDRGWWYAFTPSFTGSYLVIAENPEAVGSTINTDVELGLFTGNAHPLVEVDCLDNERGAGDGEMESITLQQGTAYYFRISVIDGSIIDTVHFTLAPAGNNWLGAVSSDWFDAANWALGRVPLATDAVFIPATNNDPIVSGMIVAYALSIEIDEGELSVATDAILEVSNDESFGILITNDGSVDIDGTVVVEATHDDDDAFIVANGYLTIGEEGLLVIEDAGIDALYVLDSIYVAGTILIGNPDDDGLDIRTDKPITFTSTSAVVIVDAREDAIYTRGDGLMTFAGVLNITNAGSDGLDLENRPIAFSSTADVTIDGIGDNGIEDGVFTNAGNITISGTGGDGINTGEGLCENLATGVITIADSNTDGIDVDFGEVFSNAGLITVNTCAEFALSDGFFRNEDGGTLRIDGIFESTSDIRDGSTLEPGSSPGCVSFVANIALGASELLLEIEGTASCTEYDQVQLGTNSIDLEEATLTLAGDYVPNAGERFIIIEKDGGAVASNDPFANISEGGSLVFNGVLMTITYTGGDGNDVELLAEAILPVELVSFTARANTKTNILSWLVSSENAFSHYELERSSDGVGAWSFLGAVAGAMEGFAEQGAYTFTDEQPRSQNYYRLKMIDLDGSFTYSNIVSLERETEGQLLVYPNPSDGRFSVELPSDEVTNVTLYDLTGRKLWAESLQAGPSSNRSWTPSGQLEAGVYLLVVTATDGARWTERIAVK
jgi:hypothetical protein